MVLKKYKKNLGTLSRWSVLAAAIIVNGLGACALTTPSPINASDRTETSASETKAGDKVRSQSAGPSPHAAAACKPPETPLEPLEAPQNTPIFEQFNFQPESLEVFDGAVIVTTPYYTFAFCQPEGQRKDPWVIRSSQPAPAEENYDEFLAGIDNPDYETIELNGQTYQYRVRLQAAWLTEQLQSGSAAGNSPDDDSYSISATTSTAPEEEFEEAVYFELKPPSGEPISHLLYTLEEVQQAQLGASLGVPTLAGAVAIDNSLWFAASASQGEGDSGFASLIHYRPDSSSTPEAQTPASSPAANVLTVERPDSIQGDQLTDLVATGSGSDFTLWLGTLRSGEGNPYFPASGLVAYRPNTQQAITQQANTQQLKEYTVDNSPLVGAIPFQLAAAQDHLWVATGNGLCQVQWRRIEAADSWNCWRYAATAQLPEEGVPLYRSFLAQEKATTLKGDSVEVLWAAADLARESGAPTGASPGADDFRYEIAYEPGFETQLSQGGYRIVNEVALRVSGGEAIFWPGRQWHWGGSRFVRGLDEVSLNLVGGGPLGLVSGNQTGGFGFDHYTIRGDFDLLSLTPEGTKIRYYAGWVDGSELEVYPTLVPQNQPMPQKPNPIEAIAANLPASAGP